MTTMNNNIPKPPDRMLYGKTKSLVLWGHAEGLTFKEVSVAAGIPENRLRYTAHRLGIKMKGVKTYAKYGSIKETVYAAHEAGMTYAEAEAKFGVPRLKLHAAAKSCGCYLKSSK